MTDVKTFPSTKLVQKPVVRAVPLGEFLADRQKVWLQTQPFDFQTENPSVYKSLLEAEEQEKEVQREARDSALEVQSLRDDPSGSCLPSSAVRILEEKRREKHSSAWSDMKEELVSISSECEKTLLHQANSAKKTIADIDKSVSRLLDQSSFKFDLHHLVYEDLVELWEIEVSKQLKERESMIERMSEELENVEKERVSLVNEVLVKWGKVFQSIGHLLPEDIGRLVDSEALMVNKAVINNKMCNAKVVWKLMTANAERERELFGQWEELLLSWKYVCKDHMNQTFKDYMDQYKERWSLDVDNVKSCWRAELEVGNRKRVHHLKQLKPILPPATTKVSCQAWYQALSSLTDDLNSLHNRYLTQLQSTQETIASTCLLEVDRCKEELMCRGVCSEEEACQFALDHLVTQVDQLQKDHSQELASYEEIMSAVMGQQIGKLQEIFQCCLGAVHLWETQLLAVEKVEQDMNVSLKKCRASHDRDNQSLENSLDLVLDQLRQGSSEEVLQDLLKEALAKLSHLSTTYKTFHQVLLDTVQDYPKVVKEAVNAYDVELCKYFKVERNPVKKKKASKVSRQQSVMTASRANSRMTASKMEMKGMSEVSMALEEVIQTTSGVTFYITKEGPPQRSESSVFLTEEATSGPGRSFVTDSVSMEDQLLEDVHKRVRLEFLNHLEQWRLHMSDKAQQTVAQKSEEFATELDLRLHLHNPRANRIECDIHHVRAAEILAHRERVSGHVASVRSELGKIKISPEGFTLSHEEMLATFTSGLHALEGRLSSSNRSSELTIVEEQLEEDYKEHLAALMASCEEKEKYIEVTAGLLCSSTQEFRQSLKLFAEGGNYSHDEVVSFGQRLDRLLVRIGSVKSQALKEMKARYEHCREVSEKTSTQFNQKLSLYRMDVEFVEKMNSHLNNCQIKIKAEVAKSNTQSESLHHSTVNLSGQLVSSEYEVGRVCDLLEKLFLELKSRVNYLYCSVHHHGALVGIDVDTPLVPLSSVTAAQAIVEFAGGKKTSDKGHPSSENKASNDSRRDVSQRKSRQSERKHVSYGIGGGKDGSGSFLPEVRCFLKDCHIEVYALSEGFYRLKGPRGVTRSDLLEATFDLCLDKVIERLQSYRKQAEAYRNECIDELRDQVDQMIPVLQSLPSEVLRRLSEVCVSSYEGERLTATNQHEADLDVFHREHSQCLSSLRPGMGHPSQLAALSDLDQKQSSTHEMATSAVSMHADSLKDNAMNKTKKFVEMIVEATKSLLAVLDNVVLSDDIIPACGKKSRKSGSIQDMLREHTAVPTALKEVSGSAGNRKWMSIQVQELACGDKTTAQKLCSSVSSKRSSPLHELVISARDAVCEEHHRWLACELKQIAEDKKTKLEREHVLSNNWTSSVDAIKRLYSTDSS